MKYLYLFFILIAFASCSNDSRLSNIIDNSSSMVIQYVDSTGKVIGKYKCYNAGEINMLNKYFTGEEVKDVNCATEGNINLKLAGGRDSTLITFSLRNKCVFINFEIDGQKYSEDMSLEGVIYFRKLRKKLMQDMIDQAKSSLH